MVIAGVLMDHHHLWPQIGEAALFFASLLHATMPDLNHPKSKLCLELGKFWVAHRDEIGTQPTPGMPAVIADVFKNCNPKALKVLQKQPIDNMCARKTAAVAMQVERRAAMDRSGAMMYFLTFTSAYVCSKRSPLIMTET